MLDPGFQNHAPSFKTLSLRFLRVRRHYVTFKLKPARPYVVVRTDVRFRESKDPDPVTGEVRVLVMECDVAGLQPVRHCRLNTSG